MDDSKDVTNVKLNLWRLTRIG